MKGLFTSSPEGYTLTKDIYPHVISGYNFGGMEVTLDYNGITVTQEVYATILRGYAIAVMLTHTSDAEKDIIIDSLNSFSFIQ